MDNSSAKTLCKRHRETKEGSGGSCRANGVWRLYGRYTRFMGRSMSSRIVSGQGDLFVANLQDIRTKHARELMETNWVSLTKRLRKNDIKYLWNDGNSYLRVYNNTEYGIANIWDMDIILYCISQLTAAQAQGQKIGNGIWFSGGDFLSFIGRSTKSRGGKAYKEIWDKLNRLHTTHIETNIRSASGEQDWKFVWVSSIRQGIDEQGRHRGYEVHIADWLVEAVRKKSLLLTLDNDYFTLTGGLERWLYLWCRKAVGKQKEGWLESYRSLWHKSGLECSYSNFTKQVRKVLRKNDGNLLNYHLTEVISRRQLCLSVELRAVKELRSINTQNIWKESTNGGR